MKISIIIPVYNVSRYIERCLNSIINQTKKDFECILVNDKTPDDSMEIIDRILKSYDGPILFNVVEHVMNRGLSAARNTGVKVCSGDYVMFVDSDDELINTAVQSFCSILDANPGVDLIPGATKSIPYSPFYNILDFANTPVIKGNTIIRHHQFGKLPSIPVCAWNKLIRKSFILDNNLWFKEGVLFEDHHWMFFATKKLKSVAFNFEESYIHYRTPDSIMSTTDSIKTASNWCLIIKDVFFNLDNPMRKNQIYKYAVFFLIKCYPIYSSSSFIETINLICKSMKDNHLFISSWLLFLYSSNKFLYRLRFDRLLSSLYSRVLYIISIYEYKEYSLQ